MVDKNLFLHDLAVVAILKNEGHYLKEWLDYHLLAGVEHFYLYDHESDDNYNEIVKPYVDAGLVTSTFYPGKNVYVMAYIDAIKKFKFFNRYMAFIDLDEFIYPKTDCGIVNVVDEILSHDPNAAGLAIHWQEFGSNGKKKADYSKGVLERFTRRAKKDFHDTFKDKTGTFHTLGNIHVKNIVNPRCVKIPAAHYFEYFEGMHGVDERNIIFSTPSAGPLPIAADKIVINHYRCKSREEYFYKLKRYRSVPVAQYMITEEMFEQFDHNDEFDDGILHYRDERAKIYQPPDNSHADERLLNALIKNLSPVLLPTTPPEFYAGKMETFLTCRAVSSYLKTRLTNDATAKALEEVSLIAILKSLDEMNLTDARMFISELPNFLILPYPAVGEIYDAFLQIVPTMLEIFRVNALWRDYIELEQLRDVLKLGG